MSFPVSELISLCEKITSLVYRLYNCESTCTTSKVLMIRMQLASEILEISRILANHFGDTYWPVDNTYPDKELHEKALLAKQAIQMFIVLWYKTTQDTTFITRAFHLSRMAEYNDRMIQDRIKLKNELNTLQRIKKYKNAPPARNGEDMDSIDAQVASVYVPDMDPKKITPEILAKARAEYMEWLKKQHVFEEQMVSEFDAYCVIWSNLTVLTLYTGLNCRKNNYLVKHLVGNIPPLSVLLKTHCIDADTFRDVKQYGMQPLTMVFTVDDLTEEILDTPIKELSLSELLWLFQWLRVVYWHLPFFNLKWVSVLSSVLQRMAEFFTFAHPIESIDAVQFCDAYEVSSVPKRSWVKPKQKKRNMITEIDRMVQEALYETDPNEFTKPTHKWYVLMLHMRRVLMVTAKGIWSAGMQVQNFQMYEKITSNPDKLNDFKSFIIDISNHIMFGQEQRQRLIRDVTSLYASFGSAEIFKLNNIAREDIPEFFVPDQLNGRVFDKIIKMLNKEIYTLVENTELAQHIRFVILLHIIDVYMITQGVTSFMMDYVYYSDKLSKTLMVYREEATNQKYPVIVQIANVFCVLYKGKLFRSKNADEMLFYFFQLLGTQRAPSLCNRNIVNILTLMGISTTTSNSTDLLNKLVREQVYK